MYFRKKKKKQRKSEKGKKSLQILHDTLFKETPQRAWWLLTLGCRINFTCLCVTLSCYLFLSISLYLPLFLFPFISFLFRLFCCLVFFCVSRHISFCHLFHHTLSWPKTLSLYLTVSLFLTV